MTQRQTRAQLTGCFGYGQLIGDTTTSAARRAGGTLRGCPILERSGRVGDGLDANGTMSDAPATDGVLR